MKTFFLFLILYVSFLASAQNTDVLNTAKDCMYMKPAEREMIFEINKLRSNPKGYLVYIQPLLVTAKQNLKQYGRGDANYAVTFTTGMKTTNNPPLLTLPGVIGMRKKLKH